MLRYQPKDDKNGQLHARIVSLAGQRRRFGYRRIHILLKREGWHINVKRVYRLYRHAGLAVRKRNRKRIGLTERVPLFFQKHPTMPGRWILSMTAWLMAGAFVA
ncbi:MAG: transposase [Nitrosospira sp.]|nr:transposase [Nitrosospira sp.]